MKENITNPIVRITQWIVLVVTILISQAARAEVVYNNSTTRETSGGNALYFAQGGYEFGDEVLLNTAGSRFLTNFTLEYYANTLPPGATMRLRIYQNDGVGYGTNFNTPGSLLYDSSAFDISGANGFNTLSFNQANSGFGIPVTGGFTWTVEFGNLGGQTAGLSLYDPATVGTNYNQMWEHSGTVGVGTNGWVYRADAANNLNFGAIAEAAILAADALPPLVSVTTPSDKYTTNIPTFTVSGTAKDAGRIALVLRKIDSGSYSPATVTSGGGGFSNWTTSVTLTPGLHTVTAKAVDQSGNSSIKRVTYTFAVFKPVVVNKRLDGVVSIYGGTITPQMFSLSTNLMINKSYALKVAATNPLAPALPTVFYSNTVFTSDSGTSATAAASYSFTMQTNMVIDVNFCTNRFLAVAGLYNGLISGTDDNDQKQNGYFTVKTDGKRGFGGKAYIAGEALSFMGAFDLSGNGTSKLVASKNQALGFNISMHLPFDGMNTIDGSLIYTNSPLPTLALDGDRWVWGPSNPSTNYDGLYTIAIPSAGSNPTAPSGYGEAQVTIDTNGVIKMAGVLADGTSIKQTVQMSQNGEWPFFASGNPDSTKKISKGSVIGWLTVGPKDSSPGISGSLTWVKSSGAADLVFYPDGFTNASAILASAYTVPGISIATGKFTNAVVDLGVNGAGVVSTADGNTDGTITNYAVTSFTNATFALTVIPPAKKPPYQAKIAATPKTGAMKGSFDNVNAGQVLHQAAWVGAALQDQNQIYGSFKGTNQTGVITIAP